MNEEEDSADGNQALSMAQSSLSVHLRGLTPARVGLERVGVSVATQHALEFSLAHAQARDAVQSSLGVASLLAAVRERGLAALAVKTAVHDRTEYLRRPDLGRMLATASVEMLAASVAEDQYAGPRTKASLILADGLSALAVERHALPLLDALLPLLPQEGAAGWSIAPVVVAEQARVALGDEIGAALGADVTVMLIGERPGLSSQASLGAYMTWAPRPGRVDAERNCVSNIHGDGLDYVGAARKIAWFVGEGRRLGMTGVKLREREVTAFPKP